MGDRDREEALDVVDPDLDVGPDRPHAARHRRHRGVLGPCVHGATSRSSSPPPGPTPRDVIAGLEAGADDYVTKPLIAANSRPASGRCSAAGARACRGDVRERSPASPAATSRSDPNREVVERRGTPVHLTQTEFRLLVELAIRPGPRGRRREQLLQRVWGYDYFADTRLLDVHVRRLRRKVEHDPGPAGLVLTVRGQGYRIGDRILSEGGRRRLSLRWRVAGRVRPGLPSPPARSRSTTWQLASGYMLAPARGECDPAGRGRRRLVDASLARLSGLAELLAGLTSDPDSSLLAGPASGHHRPPGRRRLRSRRRCSASPAAGTPASQRLRVHGVPVLAVGVPVTRNGGVYVELAPLSELDRTLRFLSATLVAGTVSAGLLGTVLGWWTTAARCVRCPS